MSRHIATHAIRGATAIVREAEAHVEAALAELGPDTPVAFTNTAYYLPVIYAFTGRKIEKLGDLPPVLARARELLHPEPGASMWLPYLGETLDAGVATLFAEEVIEGVRFARKQEPQIIKLGHAGEDAERFTGGDLLVHGDKMKLNGPIDDIQLRAWGIQLVDGRMPGFCAIVGCAKSNEVAVKIVRELQSRGILIFLSGNVNGRSIIHQLQEEGIQLGYDTFTVPFGIDTVSAVYALGFAARSALTFGGMDPGQARDIMLYNKYRVFAWVLALGEVDDLKYATAAGAISYGFPVIADTRIPQILPTGVTQYEHVVSMPFDEIPGADDMERTEKLIQRCVEVRGVKVKIAKVPIPVSYGSAFEGERIRKEIMYAEFGGKRSRAFEYLRMRPADQVEDGKITLNGLDIDGVEEGAALPLGMVVDVSGRKMQIDFEPILERQFHYFINGVEGIQHNGQRDIAWTRVS
ncbi:MAG: CO dehydrogenase/CO-methylating acetyl-CoA synthase complex subunit beta, partial [Thermoleophilia bacterium]